MRLDGVSAFKWWVSMGKHFSIKNYDVLKVRSHLKGSTSRIVTRSDYWWFERIAETFRGNTKFYVLFLACNFMYGYTNMIYNQTTALSNFEQYRHRIKFLSTTVQSDLYKILENLGRFAKPIDIIRMLTRNEIMFETCVVINQFYPNFFENIQDKSVYTIVEPLVLRIEKASPFVMYSPEVKEKFRKTLAELQLFC